MAMYGTIKLHDVPTHPWNPGKDFDVLLEPLVEELLDLWKGVSTFDAVGRKTFDLHAAIILCIHDYPALSTLSG